MSDAASHENTQRMDLIEAKMDSQQAAINSLRAESATMREQLDAQEKRVRESGGARAREDGISAALLPHLESFRMEKKTLNKSFMPILPELIELKRKNLKHVETACVPKLPPAPPQFSPELPIESQRCDDGVPKNAHAGNFENGDPNKRLKLG